MEKENIAPSNKTLHLKRKNMGLDSRRLYESAIHSAAQVSFSLSNDCLTCMYQIGILMHTIR